MPTLLGFPLPELLRISHAPSVSVYRHASAACSIVSLYFRVSFGAILLNPLSLDDLAHRRRRGNRAVPASLVRYYHLRVRCRPVLLEYDVAHNPAALGVLDDISAPQPVPSVVGDALREPPALPVPLDVLHVLPLEGLHDTGEDIRSVELAFHLAGGLLLDDVPVRLDNPASDAVLDIPADVHPQLRRYDIEVVVADERLLRIAQEIRFSYLQLVAAYSAVPSELLRYVVDDPLIAQTDLGTPDLPDLPRRERDDLLHPICLLRLAHSNRGLPATADRFRFPSPIPVSCIARIPADTVMETKNMKKYVQMRRPCGEMASRVTRRGARAQSDLLQKFFFTNRRESVILILS